MRIFVRPLIVVLLFAPVVLAQSEVVEPPENVVTEGVPPVPASLVEEVERYTNVRSASFQSWHPTRREMLVRTRFGDTAQIHHLKFPGGARRQLTFFSEPVGQAAFDPRRGDSFVFQKDVGGSEFYQLYRYDLSTGRAALLTDGRSRNTWPEWSNGGHYLAYSSTRRTGRDTDIWVMNPANPENPRLLLEVEGGGWATLDWSPDDRRLLVLEYKSINESYLWLVEFSTGEKTLLTPPREDEKIFYGFSQFSRDGRGVYVLTDRDFEFTRLAYLDLKAKEWSYLTSHIRWNVESFDLSPDGRTLAFVTNEDGIGVLHLLDTETGEEKPRPDLPPGLLGGLEWHNNSRDLAFTLETVRHPDDVFVLDAETGALERWTRSETGGLHTEELPEPELIRWETFDGRTLSGFLYRPPARFAPPWPVRISIHGGPESQARPNFLGRAAYYLNELGLALLYPNVRGSAGYGKSFLQLDNGKNRADTFKDIGTLLDWIEKQPELDADRVVVRGGSYGGFMTLATAVNYDERICCSIDVVGISSLVTFLENTEDYRRDLRRVEYGDERDPAMRAYLEKIAPLNHAANITKPLFVIQGANDPRVPRSESEQMVETVRKNGTPVWYLLALDEGHGFDKKKNRDFQFYATVLFLQRFLLGEGVSAAAGAR